MARPIRRIALSTGGGDAPGLNAVIRAATLAARNRGWDVVGIRDGFNGLLMPEQLPRRRHRRASPATSVRGIAHLGGTILGTTNRGNPTAYPGAAARRHAASRSTAPPSWSALFRAHGHRRADHHRRRRLAHHRQPPVRGRAARDRRAQDDRQRPRARPPPTFGFDTAVELRHRVHRPAVLHGHVARPGHRGRGDGSLRRAGSRCMPASPSGAHAILIPEIPFDLEPVAATIAEREQRGAKFSIVVVAEGAMPRGWRGRRCSARPSARPSASAASASRSPPSSSELTGKEARTVVLGHLLRGGSPTVVRPAARPALRRGRGAGAGGGPGRRDGGARPADRATTCRSPRSTGRHEDGAARLRHDAHRPRHRHQLRRRGAVLTRAVNAGGAPRSR